MTRRVVQTVPSRGGDGGIETTVELKGPFFEKDPGKTFRQNARAGLKAIVEEGESMVRAGAPVVTGDFRDGIIGRVKSLKGKPWALTGVVSQQHVEPWPNAGPKQYRGGKIERRLRLFRKAASVMRAKRRELNDLLRGLT